METTTLSPFLIVLILISIDIYSYSLTIRSGLSVILVKVVLILFNMRFNAGIISSADQSMFGRASSMNLNRNDI